MELTPTPLPSAPVPTPAASPALADDPTFAPFADLAGLLKLAQDAELRLRVLSHIQIPNSYRLDYVDRYVQTLWRLTAVRKTLLDLFLAAKAPATSSLTLRLSSTFSAPLPKSSNSIIPINPINPVNPVNLVNPVNKSESESVSASS